MTTKALDLNPGSTLRKPFEAAAARIPGVDFHDVSSRVERTGVQNVLFTIHGWSPSLHRVTIDMRGTVPQNVDPDLTQEQLVSGVIGQMIDVLERQIARARDADALGCDRPLPKAEIDHLLVDSGLVAIVARKGQDIRDHVRNAVGGLHADHVRHLGGPSMDNGGAMVAERPGNGATATRFATMRTAARDVRRRVVLYHNAPHLELVHDHLPDTVLAALVGSRVDKIASIDPTLDDRIVRKAENSWSDGRPIVRLAVDQHLQTLTRRPTAA